MQFSLALVIACVAINIFFVSKKAHYLKDVTSLSSTTEKEYSYYGMDYPYYHPDLTLKPAVLTLHETVRYGFNASDDVEDEEWKHLFNRFKGSGRIYVGKDHRTFLTTFYHQLHCMIELRTAHCLQYLRQTILCQADDTLESGDFAERNYEANRLGPDIQCYDWESANEELQERYMLFSDWRQGILLGKNMTQHHSK